MSIISDQVKQAFGNAVNGFLLRLLQSPGTTLGGGMAGIGGVLKMFEHSHPKLEAWADGLLSLGVALTGLNAASHGFLAKNAGTQTTSFVKVTDPTGLNLNTVGSIPPTPPPPAKP